MNLMVVVWMRAWTDWSTGKPRPVFTMTTYQSSEDSVIGKLVEGLVTSRAVKRLERELERVIQDIEKLVYPLEVGPEGFSMHALYAIFFLTAARTNVNPAHIKFVYPTGFSPEEPYISSYDVLQMIYDLKNEIFDQFFNMVNDMDRLRSSLAGANVSRTQGFSGESAESIFKMDGKLDVNTQHSLISFLWRVPETIWAFEFKKSRLFAQDIRGILRRANEEARDPDVKRLAELLEKIIDEAVKTTSELSHYLDFRALSRLSDSLDQPEKFKELKEEALKELERAIGWAQAIMREVKSLISDAEKIIMRLKNRGVLLDPELNLSEEEIKRRLLKI